MPGPERVLLVETTWATLERVRTGLRQAGFEVDAVSTMADVLDALAERSYQVVVADYDRPDLTGLELLAALQGAAPRTSRIVCATLVTEALVAQAREFGVFAVLSKPVLLETLILTVGTALEARRPRQV
jgi:DNA-binding NtrC family response regulator